MSIARIRAFVNDGILIVTMLDFCIIVLFAYNHLIKVTNRKYARKNIHAVFPHSHTVQTQIHAPTRKRTHIYTHINSRATKKLVLVRSLEQEEMIGHIF